MRTDAFHTPPALLRAAQHTCESLGWSVAVNRPFAGALVPMAHYRRDPRRTADFGVVQQRLTHLLRTLADA